MMNRALQAVVNFAADLFKHACQVGIPLLVATAIPTVAYAAPVCNLQGSAKPTTLSGIGNLGKEATMPEIAQALKKNSDYQARECPAEELVTALIAANSDRGDMTLRADSIVLEGYDLRIPLNVPILQPTPTVTPVATYVSQPVVQPVPAEVAEAQRELPRVKHKIVVAQKRQVAVQAAVDLRPDSVGASPNERTLLAKLETEIAQLKARKDNYEGVLAAYARHLKAIDGNLAAQSRWNSAQDRNLSAFQKQQAQKEEEQDKAIAEANTTANAALNAKSGGGFPWWGWVLLGLAIVASLGAWLKSFFGGNVKSDPDFKALTSRVDNLDERTPEFRFEDGWKEMLQKLPVGNDEREVVVLEKVGKDFEPAYILRIAKENALNLKVLSGLKGHNPTQLISIANLEASMRRAAFNNRLDVPVMKTRTMP